MFKKNTRSLVSNGAFFFAFFIIFFTLLFGVFKLIDASSDLVLCSFSALLLPSLLGYSFGQRILHIQALLSHEKYPLYIRFSNLSKLLGLSLGLFLSVVLMLSLMISKLILIVGFLLLLLLSQTSIWKDILAGYRLVLSKNIGAITSITLIDGDDIQGEIMDLEIPTTVIKTKKGISRVPHHRIAMYHMNDLPSDY